jgi:hypothetical protein
MRRALGDGTKSAGLGAPLFVLDRLLTPSSWNRQRVVLRR